MNVICYKRVSTDEQADRGHSLQHQEVMLTKYCEINNHNIVDIYTEDYSGKSFNRPEWIKIMSFIKKNRGKVDLILCNRWDRFSRNQYDAMTVIKELNKLGVTVNTVEQPLDISKSDNKILLSLYLTMPEVENDRISEKTTEGSWRARMNGYWTTQAPKGYDNFRDDKKSTLRPNSDAPLMIEAFKMLSSGVYSGDEVRKWLNDNKVKISKNTFLRCIRNPVYIGKIRTGAWRKEPSQIVMGLHPAIVTEDVYYRANDVLEGRRRNMKFHDDKSDLYVELLTANDPIVASKKSDEINQYNQTRKDLDKNITEEANSALQACTNLSDRKGIVVYNQEWHKGVIGIVASRLTEEYYRPAIVLTRTDDLVTGSARSVPGFDIYKAIDHCRDLLENFGGHTYAAGLSMKIENLPEFTKRFEAYVATNILPEQMVPTIDIDSEIPFREITPKFVRQLKLFNPFGPDNAKPFFCTKGVSDYGTSRLFGREQNHLKLELVDKDSQNIMNGIAFCMPQHYNFIKSRNPFDIAYSIEENNYNGGNYIQLLIKDLKTEASE